MKACLSIFALFLIHSVLLAQTNNCSWTYVGPKSNHYQYKGLFLSVWADPNDLNTVMAGSSTGGLFITNNALDELPVWRNISDNFKGLNFGISGIAVVPNTNNQAIYVSTSTGGGLMKKNLGNGIMLSKDGGLTWNSVGPKAEAENKFPLDGLVMNLQNPKEMITYIGKQLFITKDAWETFKTYNLPVPSEIKNAEICEVHYAPFEPGKIYAVTKTYLKNNAQLFVSYNYGETWTDITPKDVACERISLSTLNSPKYKGKFYIAHGNSQIYIKYFNGKDFTPNLNEEGVSHIFASSYWCLNFKVNHLDTSLMYLGMTEISKSNTGGSRFVKIGTYNGVNSHADIRAMILPVCSLNDDDKLLIANDGGVSMLKKHDPVNGFFKSLNGPGLEANQFWGIDAGQTQEEFVCGGTQDNGSFFIKKNKESNNLTVCGDSYYGLILNDSMALTECNPPGLLLHNFNNGLNQYITVPDQRYEVRRPLYQLDSFVYIGHHDVWRIKVKDLVNYNINFTNISNIPLVSDAEMGVLNNELKDIAINISGECMLVYNNPFWQSKTSAGKLYYSSNINDPREKFIDITAVAKNKNVELFRWAQVESMVADNEERNKFYFIYKDVFDQSNSEIYEMKYIPDSNFVSLKLITRNLKMLGFNRLKMDKRSNVLYLAMNDGVYFYNNADSTWENLNGTVSALPKVIVSDVSFNYYTNTLYAATFGRGIWRTRIPALLNQRTVINRNSNVNEVLKVDGVLIVKPRKSVVISSKLIITKGSKIILQRGSKLIIKNKELMRDQSDQAVDINQFIEKHKSASIVYLR